jgi:hypothetical protein
MPSISVSGMVSVIKTVSGCPTPDTVDALLGSILLQKGVGYDHLIERFVYWSL